MKLGIAFAIGSLVVTASPFGLVSDEHDGHAAKPKAKAHATTGGWVTASTKKAATHSTRSTKSSHSKRRSSSHKTSSSKAHTTTASHKTSGGHMVLASHAAPVANSVKIYPPFVTPKDAFWKLEEGNARFVSGMTERPRADAARRAEVAKKQHPYAVIVTCSDSRLSPELIFDQGLGDLFVVRVAGNTIDKVALGSIEYALEHLDAHLVVVMGHERCGAVDAAMKGGHAPGSIGAVVDPILAAIKGKKTLDDAVESNVKLVAARLAKGDALMKELLHTGEFKIVGARYDLDSGKVTWIKTGGH